MEKEKNGKQLKYNNQHKHKLNLLLFTLQLCFGWLVRSCSSHFPTKSLRSFSDSPAMSLNGESTPPPPVIGKIGPYTVFMTPPSTPKPSSSDPVALHSPKPIINAKIAPPPPQIHTPLPSSKTLSSSDASVLGFFQNAVNKVQTGNCFTLSHYFVV